MSSAAKRRAAQRERDAVDSPAFDVVDDPLKGSCLAARRRIQRGDPIGFYTGDRVDYTTNLPPEEERYRAEYGLLVDYSEETGLFAHVLLPKRGSVGMHLAEHSCEPNARIDTGRKDHRVAIVAARDIEEGERISIYYEWLRPPGQPDYPPCSCGAKSCTGQLAITFAPTASGATVNLESLGRFVLHYERYGRTAGGGCSSSNRAGADPDGGVGGQTLYGATVNCQIGKSTYKSGDLNPANSCESCQPSVSTTL